MQKAVAAGEGKGPRGASGSALGHYGFAQATNSTLQISVKLHSQRLQMQQPFQSIENSMIDAFYTLT